MEQDRRRQSAAGRDDRELRSTGHTPRSARRPSRKREVGRFVPGWWIMPFSACGLLIWVSLIRWVVL